MTGKGLIVFVILFIVSESFAAIASIIRLSTIKHSLARLISICLFCTVIDQVFQLASNLDRPLGVHYSHWFVIKWAIGRSVRSFGFWLLYYGLNRVTKEEIRAESIPNSDNSASTTI